MKQCEIKELYDLSQTIAGEYLARFTYPWEALDGIKNYIREVTAYKGFDELSINSSCNGTISCIIV